MNRKILIGGVSLVMGKLRGDGPAMVAVCDELDPLLDAADFFDGAPFKYVSLIIRYGLANRLKPEYQRVVKKYGELPVAIELDMDMLKSAEKDGSLKHILCLGALEALIDVGNKYGLPIEQLIRKKVAVEETTGVKLNSQPSDD